MLPCSFAVIPTDNQYKGRVEDALLIAYSVSCKCFHTAAAADDGGLWRADAVVVLCGLVGHAVYHRLWGCVAAQKGVDLKKTDEWYCERASIPKYTFDISK
jgi:hypothetical protein